MKEDDAMVYRRPYLTSGSSGFALNAISRAMKKELKVTYQNQGLMISRGRLEYSYGFSLTGLYRRNEDLTDG